MGLKSRNEQDFALLADFEAEGTRPIDLRASMRPKAWQ